MALLPVLDWELNGYEKRRRVQLYRHDILYWITTCSTVIYIYEPALKQLQRYDFFWNVQAVLIIFLFI